MCAGGCREPRRIGTVSYTHLVLVAQDVVDLDAGQTDIQRMDAELGGVEIKDGIAVAPVSYTHLDVYKRQVLVSFRHGAKWGLFTGFVNSCLQISLLCLRTR